VNEKNPPAGSPGRIHSWRLEACLGTDPLSVIASDGPCSNRSLPAGALAVWSVRLDLDDGPWYAAASLLLGRGTL
jgi:hypothetical protein